MERLIVDGYNVIFSDAVVLARSRTTTSTALARGLSRTSPHTVAGEARGTVVFDGAGNPASDGSPHHVAGVTVMFSRRRGDADTVIEGLAARARDRGERAVVVTSDAAHAMGGDGRQRDADVVGRVWRPASLRSQTNGSLSYLPVRRKGALRSASHRRSAAALSRWAKGRRFRNLNDE